MAGMIHAVDMYPTLAKLAGASTAKCKPLDGIDVWQSISEGKPSPRTEIVYNVEPCRGAVRQGDWKLIWRTLLPSSVDLYNLAEDPYEKNNVAAAHLTRNFCFDYIGGRRIPVVAGDIPHHGAQAEFARNPQSRGTPSSKWWTKEVRMRSDCVF